MMLVIMFSICWLVFVSTKISAAVVNNDIDSNGDYGLVKGLAQMKDPVDFRFTKFMDIRFDVNNNSTFDTGGTIHSGMDRDLRGIQNHERVSPNPNHQDPSGADNNQNNFLLKKLEALTYQFQNLSDMLIEMNGQIRKNISYLSENQISIHKDIQYGRCSISKSSNGVTYNGIYPRINPGRTKDNQTVNIPRDCKDVQDRGIHVSGVYEIQPKLSSKPFLVLCDMETRGGGWTIIQKRFDGSQDFYLGWREYKFGFGDLDGEFWLGLENIYFLTSVGAELLLEVEEIDQKTSYAHYGTFKIGPEPDGYPLSTLNNFSGDNGDVLSHHVGQKFSTKDLDQDQHSISCAEDYFGAWWYNACYKSNLNGKYINLKVSGKYRDQGVRWDSGKTGHNYTLAKTKMLVRQTIVV